MNTLRRSSVRRMALALLAFPALAIGAPLGAQQGAAPAGGAAGTWEGALSVGALRLRLAMELKLDSAGALSGELVSIDQGGGRIPVSARVQGDSVHVEVAAIRAKYDARVSVDSLAGTWTQGPGSMPLTLRRTARLTMPNRPQEPSAPYPYRAEDVTFESAEAGVRLAGTLTLPQGPGPFPAVVLVSGSGAQDRDESLMGHRPFLVLADHLTRRGIAVLRFDDRGVGKSGGTFSTATSEDFAEDALGGVRYLRARPEVALGRVGIAGHSEGGVIAPMAAVRAPDEVGFLVLLAGTGIPGDSILMLQGRLIAKASGVPDATIERTAAAQARMFAAVRQGGDSAAVRGRVQVLADEMMAAMSEEERRASGITPALMTQQVSMLASPWFRFFLTYDPRPTLRQVRVPVLAVNGSLDLQVPPQENLAAIEAALRAGGNRDVRVVEFPALNHLFQTSKTGAPSEYGSIEETMSPAVLQAVSDWILERFGPGR